MSSPFDISKLLSKKAQEKGLESTELVTLTCREKISFVARLSFPGILSQISTILMQYIDAAMVGHLGAGASASIGLVSSSTWLISGFVNALGTGFSIKCAHAVGEGQREKVKKILFQSIFFCSFFSLCISFLFSFLSRPLPLWLGASSDTARDASSYFFVFVLSIPFFSLFYLLCGLLQSCGNMKAAGFVNIIMCFFDIAFNFLFIEVFSLGVTGAALGTCAAVFLSLLIIAFYVFFSQLKKGGVFYCENKDKNGECKNLKKRFLFYPDFMLLKEAVKLAFPLALESCAFSGALVLVTRIVAPLGDVALASNSFATTAESLCYMMGYGIQEAATVLVGQSTGARRKDLVKSFSKITVVAGILLMTLSGLLMFFICPYVFSFLTDEVDVQKLSCRVLRIELFAEPLFAASIVASGALRGMGDTLLPGIMNLCSIYIVRLLLSLFLVQSMGLEGIWIAMAVELSFRGIIFLLRLAKKIKN